MRLYGGWTFGEICLWSWIRRDGIRVITKFIYSVVHSLNTVVRKCAHLAHAVHALVSHISSIHSFIHTHYTQAGMLAGWAYDTTIAAHTTCEIQLFSFRWTKAVTDRRSTRLYYACSLIYRQWSNMWELSYVYAPILTGFC